MGIDDNKDKDADEKKKDQDEQFLKDSILLHYSLNSIFHEAPSMVSIVMMAQEA